MRDADTLVLCYHAVSERWPSELAVRPQALRAQVEDLLARGLAPKTFTDAVRDRRGRSFAVTFDDAYLSVFANARPILAELGVPATLFVPTDFPDSGIPFPLPGGAYLGSEYEDELAVMSWDQVRRLRDEGWEIGSHTCSHPWLTRISERELRQELEASREACAAQLGRAPISIAYPYGDHDDRVVAAAAASGYEVACTVPHRFDDYGSSPLRFGRIDVTRSESARSFRVRTSAGLRRLRETRPIALARWLDVHRPHRSTVLAAARRPRQLAASAGEVRRLCTNWRAIVAAARRGHSCGEVAFRDGVVLTFATPSSANAVCFEELFVERAFTRHFGLSPGDVVVDIGADAGLFSVFALGEGSARVLAFQPDAEHLVALAANVRRNPQLEAVEVVPEPLSAEDGGRAGLAVEAALAAHGIDRVDLLRIGLGGLGPRLLADAPDPLLERTDRIAIAFDRIASGVRSDEVVARLRTAGFETWVDLDQDGASGYIAARSTR